jgi:isocitrate/isopropylmalate dehydrogenase
MPSPSAQETSMTYRIATIPGDGIGKEVVPAGQRVLETLALPGDAFRCEFENLPGVAIIFGSTAP